MFLVEGVHGTQASKGTKGSALVSERVSVCLFVCLPGGWLALGVFFLTRFADRSIVYGTPTYHNTTQAVCLPIYARYRVS